MISASHNPMPDNGLSSFALWLPADAAEDQIELLGTEWDHPTRSPLGEVNADHAWAKDSTLRTSVGAVVAPTRGMKIATDQRMAQPPSWGLGGLP